MTKIQWPTDEKLTELINFHKSYTDVAKLLNCNAESVRLRAHQRKLNATVNKQNYSCNENMFLNENDLSYYLLGAYISDGNVEKYKNRMSISSIDNDWISQMRDIISPKSIIYNKNNAYIFRFSSHNVRNWLIANECVPKKSLIVKLPKIPDKYFRDFIRGVFDGDGSISTKFYVNSSKYSRTNKKYCYKWINVAIHSGSESFIKSLSDELNKLKLKHIVSSEINKKAKMKNGRIIHSKNRIFRIVFNAKDGYNFLKWIYYSDEKLHLNRKRIKAEEIFSYYDNI